MTEHDRISHIDMVRLLTGEHGGAPVSHALSHDIQPHILRSWERCVSRHKLDPAALDKPIRVSDKTLRDYRESLEEFLFFAQSGMRKLFTMLSSVGYVLLLCNSEGVTIDYVGDPKDAKDHRDAGLYPGVVWQESLAGTNGVGACLEERRTLTIHRKDHFFAPFTALSCTAAPLYAPDGSLLGALNASLLNPPESKDSQAVTMLLVNSHARLTENAYLLRKCRENWIIRFNKNQAFVEVATEYLIAVNAEGTIVAANYNARNELSRNGGCSPIDRHICDVFKLSFEDVVNHALNRANMVFAIRAVTTGVQYFAIFSAPGSRHQAQAERRLPGTGASCKTGTPDLASLDQLAGGDRDMARNVERAKRVMNRNIPILLTGETGVGKEVFARAIHEASARASKPFIALNCASIPESLIESELFGYRQGAFTGANIKGMRGKILQADGGTLFLDEIGDMPLNLQTRLLRVLSEREVLPLGCEKTVKIDLNVICATLRDLEGQVQRGLFRQDLYFRLNGITITLPPLRERKDKEALIRNIMAMDRENDAWEIRPDALEWLLRYQWPGNIRELRNVIRHAQAMCEGGVIRPDDLPLEKLTHSVDDPLLGNDAQSRCCSVAGVYDERARLEAALHDHKWNIAGVSRSLGISRPTIYKKIKNYRIEIPHRFDRNSQAT